MGLKLSVCVCVCVNCLSARVSVVSKYRIYEVTCVCVFVSPRLDAVNALVCVLVVTLSMMRRVCLLESSLRWITTLAGLICSSLDERVCVCLFVYGYNYMKGQILFNQTNSTRTETTLTTTVPTISHAITNKVRCYRRCWD